jgi:hypothetical protein
MARYRKIDPRMWNDDKFRTMSHEGQLVWIYMLTGPDSNRIGLYQFSIARASEDIGIETASVRRSIDVIMSSGMAFYDDHSRLIFIPKWLEYNEPSGANQAVGLLDDVEDFGSHPFAKAVRFLITLRIMAIPGRMAQPIDKKQAILVRDGVQCSYCRKELMWSDFELDHVIPASRGDGIKRYDLLVASCRGCNQKKGSRTAEDFGFPFVRAGEYSIQEALIELAVNTEVRRRFSNACNGLPAIYDEIEEFALYLMRSNAMLTATERRSNAVVTQEQEQEQKQEQKQEPEHKSKQGGGSAPENLVEYGQEPVSHGTARETVYEPDPDFQPPVVEQPEDTTRFDEIVLSIAKAHPRAVEVVKSGQVVNYMVTAILSAAEVEAKEGEYAKTMRDAFTYLLRRTILYRQYTAKWPDSEKRFIADPARFYENRTYRQPEAQWERNGPGPGGGRRESAAQVIDRAGQELIAEYRRGRADAGGTTDQPAGKGPRSTSGLKPVSELRGTIGGFRTKHTLGSF